MDCFEYVLCVLHLRIRLVGHVFHYVCGRINAHKPSHRRVLCSRLCDELERCRVSKSLISVDDKLVVHGFDHFGDVADLLCNHNFSLNAVLSMYRFM